ncbi:hypothetical protein NDU88_005858 [Pleurodeles waltl]|uniref:Uncharacterized protein n=1 Tax=Pleurodeles waltl TaxID=8319 RepID=A0AAV7NP06_PLEWA|nr:hypothetical protein NDU88_005858 [Pleurodeles waltl]
METAGPTPPFGADTFCCRCGSIGIKGAHRHEPLDSQLATRPRGRGPSREAEACHFEAAADPSAAAAERCGEPRGIFYSTGNLNPGRTTCWGRSRPTDATKDSAGKVGPSPRSLKRCGLTHRGEQYRTSRYGSLLPTSPEHIPVG